MKKGKKTRACTGGKVRDLFFGFFFFFGGVDGARTSQTLSSDTKIDVSLKGEMKVQSWKGRKKGRGGRTVGRMATARPCLRVRNGGLCGWKENEGEIEVCLDKLNLDLDTEITTKSKLRALKIA